MEKMNDAEGDVAGFVRWKDQRHAELGGADSWLGMTGLYWLEPGSNRVGSAPEALVQLPGGPPHLGDLHAAGQQVFWQPARGERRELQTDLAGEPSRVDFENWSFFVVDREGRLAARVRDRHWAASRPFAGLDYFDYAPDWAIDADWQALSPPLRMDVPNVSGDLKSIKVAWQAVFEIEGQRVTLLPMSVGTEIFFVFRDRTSGRETYGAGRFLKAEAAVDGKIRLNFNKAYNPPCAFTAFATCPLPPPENWLPFPVMAGEKKYASAQ